MPHAGFWRLTGYESYLPPAGSLTPALGYRLRVSVAMSASPAALLDGELAYFDVVSEGERTADGRTHWRGDSDVLFAASRLISRDPLDSLLSAASKDVSRVWYEEDPGQTHGGWTVGPGDRVEFAMRVERAGRTVLTVTGIRIAAATGRVRH